MSDVCSLKDVKICNFNDFGPQCILVKCTSAIFFIAVNYECIQQNLVSFYSVKPVTVAELVYNYKRHVVMMSSIVFLYLQCE